MAAALHGLDLNAKQPEAAFGFVQAHGEDIARLELPFGNELDAPQLRAEHKPLLAALQVNVRQVDPSVLDAAHPLELLFDPSAHLNRKAEVLLQLRLLALTIGMQQFEQ